MKQKKFSYRISAPQHFIFALPAVLSSVLFLCLFLPSSVSAQQKKPQNLPKRDHNAVNFGFSLGVNKTDFVVDPIKDFRKQDSVFNVVAEAGSGFNLGIMSEWRLREHLSVRFVPDLSFTQRTLVYTFDTSKVKTKDTQFQTHRPIESTFLEFPIDVKYKSVRINNYRWYIFGGMKYSIDMASQKKVDLNNVSEYKALVKIDKTDYGYFLGFGIDCYLEYFRFSPEIKVYHGFNNLIVHDSHVYSTVIDKLHSKIFVLSFVFE